MGKKKIYLNILATVPPRMMKVCGKMMGEYYMMGFGNMFDGGNIFGGGNMIGGNRMSWNVMGGNIMN